MNRLNRHNTFRNRLLERISGVMFNDNGAAPSGGGSAPTGGDPGGGGGGGGAPAPSGGGQQQQDANHSFGTSPPPSPNSGERVAALLAQGNTHPDMSISFDDISELIRFDAPFTTPAPAAPTPNAATVPPPPPAPAPAPATPPALSPDAQAIVDALRNNLPQPQQPQAPAAPAAPVPYYGGEVPALQVTPDIVSALVGSSDPAILQQAAPAINTLVNGIMNRVIADQTARMQSTIATLMANHVPQAIQQHHQVNTLETQFYSTNKHLDKPNLKPLVNQISGLYAAAQKKTDPNFQWSPQHFSTVAQLVSRQFERMYGVPLAGTGPVTTNAPGAQPPANNQTVPPAPQQPYMSSGSTRPPVVAPNANQSADLLAFVN